MNLQGNVAAWVSCILCCVVVASERFQLQHVLIAKYFMHPKLQNFGCSLERVRRSLVPLFFASLVPLFFCVACAAFLVGIGIFPVNYRIKWCFHVLLF